LNRARRGLENRSYLDEGRMEKLETGLKQMELIANEAESKYEEVGLDNLCHCHKIHTVVIRWKIKSSG
jgi:hypothetical protein